MKNLDSNFLHEALKKKPKMNHEREVIVTHKYSTEGEPCEETLDVNSQSTSAADNSN